MSKYITASIFTLFFLLRLIYVPPHSSPLFPSSNPRAPDKVHPITIPSDERRPVAVGKLGPGGYIT